jgi:hypothetical protein
VILSVSCSSNSSSSSLRASRARSLRTCRWKERAAEIGRAGGHGTVLTGIIQKRI